MSSYICSRTRSSFFFPLENSVFFSPDFFIGSSSSFPNTSPNTRFLPLSSLHEPSSPLLVSDPRNDSQWRPAAKGHRIFARCPDNGAKLNAYSHSLSFFLSFFLSFYILLSLSTACFVFHSFLALFNSFSSLILTVRNIFTSACFQTTSKEEKKMNEIK
ncbi:unnamed protein product [Acanthosepion pharaonis]|uniref:Uncharacterized protein n=1 Tax=Acanthosepion pharaonis TaxID=158019 RepID=A0A812BCC8_ACAPH|nr:unnamed protein product [Sepia pharaonis]